MKLTKEEKDLYISSFLIVFSIVMIYLSLNIGTRRDFVESSQIFPFILSTILLILSFVYLISTYRAGARFNFSAFIKSLTSLVREENNRGVIFAMFIVAVFIFFAIPQFGFYLSGAVFMAFVMLFYLRKKYLLYLISAVAMTGILYYIFAILFKLPIR